ncbi:hypothetical protein [Vreelandella titanicae]|uniref:hypothetical protein n=1 Tax=Vreelandella titanicae TaxID=664683 RepID=UPI0039BF3608
MELRIDVDPDILTVSELKDYLEAQTSLAEEGVDLEVRDAQIKTRVLDAVVLVAIVGAAGTALTALITGLLKVAQQSQNQTIIIVGKKGQRLEFPAYLDDQEVKKLIEQVKDLDAERITIP